VVTQPTTQPTRAATGENDEGNDTSHGLALGHEKHRIHIPPGQLRKAQNPPPRGRALGHRKHYPPGQARKAERSGDSESNEDDGQDEGSHGNSGHEHPGHDNSGHEHPGHDNSGHEHPGHDNSDHEHPGHGRGNGG
jgi:hypothetical protein